MCIRDRVNGEYTQTCLSAREIDESAVTDQWMNSHLIYTHGYGITLSRVDKVTDSGQPDMMIDSIPVSYTHLDVYKRQFVE